MQVVFDERHQIIGDHRQSAEKKLVLSPVFFEDGADLGDVFTFHRAHHVAVGLVIDLDLLKFPGFFGSQCSVFFLAAESVPGFSEFTVTLIIMEVDEQCGGFEVFTNQIVLVNRAVEKFLLCQFFVDPGRFEGRYVFQQLGNRLRRAFHKGDVEDRSHGFDPLQLFQVLAEITDRIQNTVRQKFPAWFVADHQEVRGVVPLIDQPCVFQVLVIFQQQGLGGGIDFQLARLITEERHSEQDQ